MYPHPVRLPMHIISVQSARHMRMHAFSIRNRVYTFWMDVDNCTFFQLMKHAQTSSVYQYKYKRLTHKPPTNYYMHRARYTRLEQRFNFSLILYAVRECVCVCVVVKARIKIVHACTNSTLHTRAKESTVEANSHTHVQLKWEKFGVTFFRQWQRLFGRNAFFKSTLCSAAAAAVIAIAIHCCHIDESIYICVCHIHVYLCTLAWDISAICVQQWTMQYNWIFLDLFPSVARYNARAQYAYRILITYYRYWITWHSIHVRNASLED